MFLHRVEYRTVDGERIERLINLDSGITIEGIDSLACQYLEKTGRQPETVFLRQDLYARLCADLIPVRYATNSNPHHIKSFWLATGYTHVVAVPNAHIPVFVGSKEEFIDNDLNQVFEDVVLLGKYR